MEHNVRNLTALGLLVVVAAGLFVWGFFYMMGDPILSGGMEIVTRIDDGAGLERSSPVRLNGVQVGTVRSVELVPSRGVEVVLKIDSDLRLAADTRAVVRPDVFGGTAAVELRRGDALVSLEPGDTIQGVTMQALPALASELGDQARTVLASADSLLSPDAVMSLRATASVLPSAAQQLQAAFAEFRLAAAALRRTAEQMEGAEAGPAVAGAFEELQYSARAISGAATTLEASAGSFASVMGKIDAGAGTLGRLVNDTTLYGELSATLREVRQLAADVQQNPRKYLNLEIF